MSLIRKRKQIVAWLDKNLISNYTIIKDKQYGHIVNIDGNVSLSYKKLKKIPFKFNKINGNFDCSNNSVICLQGAPDIINGSFYCSYNMTLMFSKSKFNGNISKWDVSGWNTSNVVNMEFMFHGSAFNGDINEWKQYIDDMFSYSCTSVPYWAKIENNEDRKNAIDAYHNKKQLEQLLDKVDNKLSIIKI